MCKRKQTGTKTEKAVNITGDVATDARVDKRKEAINKDTIASISNYELPR